MASDSGSNMDREMILADFQVGFLSWLETFIKLACWLWARTLLDLKLSA